MREFDMEALAVIMGCSTQERIKNESNQIYSVIKFVIVSFLLIILSVFVTIVYLGGSNKTENLKTVTIVKEKIITIDTMSKIANIDNIVKIARKGKQRCVYYHKDFDGSSHFYTVCR